MANDTPDLERKKRRRRFWTILFAVTLGVAVLTVGLTALLVNILSTSRRRGIRFIASSS